MKYNREEFVKIVAKHEGVVLKPYKDSLGISTIGIGRNLEDRGITDGELMHMNRDLEDVISNGLTEEEAYYLAKNNIHELEDELDRAIPWWRQLDDARQRALINLSYNVGTTTLLKFKKTLQYLEDGSYEEAAKEVLDSRWADQVGRRAIFISNVFLTGEEE